MEVEGKMWVIEHFTSLVKDSFEILVICGGGGRRHGGVGRSRHLFLIKIITLGRIMHPD